jgi:hypothetical protein
MAGPTLLMRLDVGDAVYLGRDCHTIANEIADGITVLDSQWSHPADEWKGGWPRPRLEHVERSIRDAIAVLVDNAIDVPAPLVAQLLAALNRVSK